MEYMSEFFCRLQQFRVIVSILIYYASALLPELPCFIIAIASYIGTRKFFRNLSRTSPARATFKKELTGERKSILRKVRSCLLLCFIVCSD